MLAKMGVGRGEAPEVSPLLRAEDGRVGEATRDAAPVEDDRDSPTTSGWFASRGARVATAAVLGIVVIGCVVGALPYVPSRSRRTAPAPGEVPPSARTATAPRVLLTCRKCSS